MKKTSYSPSYIIKKLTQKIFKFIYGEINYDQDLIPRNNILIKKTKILKKNNGQSYKVCKIDKGRIYTDHVENVAIIKNNTILDNFSYQTHNGLILPLSKNACVDKGTPRLKKYFKGNTLNLAQGASGHTNYFHWLFDILPKIKIFSEVFDLSDLDYIYFNNLKSYQEKTLDHLGLKSIKTISSNKFRHVEADKLYATEHPWYFKGTILEQANNIPGWIIEWLDKSFSDKGIKFDVPKKIFVDRTESPFNHCQFINEKEISEFLLKKGFVKYKVGHLNFEEQIYLFNNANVIFGAHGAAFANLVFCKKGTRVIEIKPEYHPNKISKKIAEIKELNFSLIETAEIKNKQMGDIELDLNILKNLL